MPVTCCASPNPCHTPSGCHDRAAVSEPTFRGMKRNPQRLKINSVWGLRLVSMVAATPGQCAVRPGAGVSVVPGRLTCSMTVSEDG